MRVSRLALLSSRTFLTSAALLILPAGCPGGRSASFTTPVDTKAAQAARPEALNQATLEIRAGQGAHAQARVQAWLNANASSPYRAEGFYLLGQAQFTQKDFQAAKASHDQALDLTQDRTTKALAMLGRADCNYELTKFHEASRQYHWLEEMYRDVTAVPHDELLFKLGLCAKKVGLSETADYWFNRVVELYGTGTYAAEARRMNSKLGPGATGEATFYSLEMASFGDEAKALQEAETYRAKGYSDVKVEAFQMLGTTYYSVQVGRFTNRNDAKRAKEDAELAGLSASIRPALIHIPR